jgi:hypothetical protein
MIGATPSRQVIQRLSLKFTQCSSLSRSASRPQGRHIGLTLRGQGATALALVKGKGPEMYLP